MRGRDPFNISYDPQAMKQSKEVIKTLDAKLSSAPAPTQQPKAPQGMRVFSDKHLEIGLCNALSIPGRRASQRKKRVLEEATGMSIDQR